MARDFDIIVKHFPENHDIKIYPISDVHLGAAEHLHSEWEAFCENLLNDPCAFVTLGGDLINNSIRSSVANPFDETMRPSVQKRVMAEMLKPLKDRIICAVAGNHENRSRKDADDDPMYDILAKLDLEDIYRENIAFVKVQIGDVHGDGKANPTYLFAVTHGAGGGNRGGGRGDNRGGGSYAGGSYGYSMDDGIEEMMEKAEELLEMAENSQQKQAIHRFIKELERM